jgi:LysM repeat protein
MTPNQKWFIGCLGLAVIVLFGALGAFAFLQIPDVAEQLPPNSSPITVTLKTPLNGANVPMDAFTTVTADSIGAQPFAALELWVDGALLKTQAAPPGSNLNPFGAFWTWTPAGEGQHTLFVRAMDASKSIGTSNIVHVTATKDANADATANYKTQSGDTLSDLALQFHTTPQEIVDLNPQINSNNPITSGQNISVPIPLSPPPTPNPPPEAQPAPPPGEPPPASAGQPNNFSFWINKNILNYFSVPLLPVSPGLAKKEDGCNVKLFITDNSNNEDGFFVYRADANSQVFKRIATLGSQNGTGAFTYVDSNLYGPLAYYVASFNTAGESPSQYVQAEITNAACLISPWQMIQLNQAKIVVQQPVDMVYCYLSPNNEPWTRVPPVPNTFIFPQNG